MTDVYVFISDGTEECEALIMVDLLRRAEIDVKTVAVKGADEENKGEKKLVTYHGISLECDISIDSLKDGGDEAPCLFIPGGIEGTNNFKKSNILRNLLKKQMDRGDYIVAVCAGPSVLGHFGLLEGRHATIYPGMDKELGTGKYVDERIVVDKNIITGLGLGASIDLALTTIAALKGKDAADQIAKKICHI